MTGQEIKKMIGNDKLKDAATALKKLGKVVDGELTSINEIARIKALAIKENRFLTDKEADTLFRLNDEVSWSLIKKCDEL